MNQPCPLCHHYDHYFYSSDNNRDYWKCSTCKLIFVPSTFYLNEEAERARYDLHTNTPDDIGYRKFLNRMFLPLNQRISRHSHGLDFGSGPGPTLSLMFEEAGHTMRIYDYFYANNARVFEEEYDFITTTEVVEHLHHIKEELERLWRCLKRDGYLGIMTSRYDEINDFEKWHYKLDPTHICFFSIESFKWLSEQWDCKLIIIDKDIVILQKKQLHD